MNDGFENFYNSVKDNRELNENWDESSKQMKRNNRKITFAIIMTIAIVNIIIYLVLKKVFYMNIWFIIGFIIQNWNVKEGGFIILMFAASIIIVLNLMSCLLVGVIFFPKKNSQIQSQYNDLYKEKVIDKLLKVFFNDVDYVPKKGMPPKVYDEGGYGSYEIYTSDDYMEASLSNDHKIIMANITTCDTREVTTTDAKGNTSTHIETFVTFSGLFAKITTRNSINDELLIFFDNTFKLAGLNKLKMDHKYFENNFDVYIQDKIKGMEILTHDVMNILLDFKKKYNKKFEIAVRNDNVYIRTHVGEMFETSMKSKDAIDEAYLREYYNAVKFIDDLSNSLTNVIEETQV